MDTQIESLASLIADIERIKKDSFASKILNLKEGPPQRAHEGRRNNAKALARYLMPRKKAMGAEKAKC